jgi:hypothetical protein
MKWLTAIAALATVLAVAGTSAAGSAAKDPRVPALQKQVAALQQQVQHDELVVTCGAATQQAYNIANVNLWATLLDSPQYSGPQPDDGGACAKLGLAPPASRSLSAQTSTAGLQSVLRQQLRLFRMH